MKMSKENEFKILYWNIHFMDGSKSSDEKIKNSSEIIVDIIKEYNDEIKAIVFTEAYPQFKYDKYNTIILDYLKGLGYNVYPYDLKEYSNPNHYPFKKNAEFKNGILIATKSEAQLVGMPQNEPNLLGVRIKYKKLGLNLIGVRLFSNHPEHIKKIAEYIDIDKANIVIGDFNMKDEELQKNLYIINKDIKISKKNEFGTNVALCKDIKGNEEIAKFCINSPDKLLLLNCNGKFNMEKTPEQIYCNKEFVDNEKTKEDRSINERYGRLKEGVCELVIKHGKRKKRNSDELVPYNYAKANVNNDQILWKNNYKNFGIRFTYNSCNVCNAPFPDHNLMIASIDI